MSTPSRKVSLCSRGRCGQVLPASRPLWPVNGEAGVVIRAQARAAYSSYEDPATRHHPLLLYSSSLATPVCFNHPQLEKAKGKRTNIDLPCLNPFGALPLLLSSFVRSFVRSFPQFIFAETYSGLQEAAEGPSFGDQRLAHSREHNALERRDLRPGELTLGRRDL